MSVKYKLAIFGSNIYDMSDKYQFYPVECTVKKLFLILIKFSKFKKKKHNRNYTSILKFWPKYIKKKLLLTKPPK